MDAHHRKKAVIGLAVWFVLFVAIVALIACQVSETTWLGDLSEQAATNLGMACVLLQFPFFFWGGYHLAKAKGYPYVIILFGLGATFFQLILLTCLFFLPDRNAQPSSRRSKKQYRTLESPIALNVRYRRNALLGNVIGLFGSIVGFSLILFPGGFSADPSDMEVVGLYISIGGYAGVLTGCWWWIKAKAWNEAVLFIGLTPLVICLIPWARLTYVVFPMLLPILMFIMPLILIVVMLALPDKSGLQKRRIRR